MWLPWVRSSCAHSYVPSRPFFLCLPRAEPPRRLAVHRAGDDLWGPYQGVLLRSPQLLAGNRGRDCIEQLGQSTYVVDHPCRVFLLIDVNLIATAIVQTVTTQEPFDPNVDTNCAFLPFQSSFYLLIFIFQWECLTSPSLFSLTILSCGLPVELLH